MCIVGLPHKSEHLKLRVLSGGAAGPVHTVVALGGAGQGGVLLLQLSAASQGYLTHQQQARAVRLAGPGVLHAGAERDRGGAERRGG